MKIGIFGGSFNPPHNMHKQIALDLVNKNYLDKVIYVPTGDYYQKDDLIPAPIRYTMLKIMTKDYPNLEVSDYEIKNKLVYTYQTLDYFRQKYPKDQIYFICGTDNLKELYTWKNYKHILTNYKLLVIKRNHDQVEEILKYYQEYSNNIIILNIIQSKISSTTIREKISNNYEPTSKELDKNVLNYIKKKSLYKPHHHK